MKAKFGIVMTVLGSVLLTAALGLFLYNAQEQKQAGDSLGTLMPQLVDAIYERQDNPAEETTGTAEDFPEYIVTEPPQKYMPVVEVDGYDYVGFVGIPALGLELPVMADWSYPKLKIAPCRFTGDMYTDDLVVMAHNYNCHFGRLQNLREGDTVTVTDMDGVTEEYAVTALDVLNPTAVEEMSAGAYDLTLFTCTYGGKSRITVRCDKIQG